MGREQREEGEETNPSDRIAGCPLVTARSRPGHRCVLTCSGSGSGDGRKGRWEPSMPCWRTAGSVSVRL
jgi:hypothetical protein